VNRIGGAFIAVVLTCTSALLGFAGNNYLTEYLSGSYAPAIGVAIGCIFAATLAISVSRATSRGWGIGAILIALLIVGAYPISCLIGRVTFAEFGLTTYGIIPVPGLDITVDSNGLLWFRDKTHLITETEITRLLDDNVEVAVIGTGWNNAARLASGVAEDVPVKLVVLSTPEAFAEFHRLKAAGVSAVLLAHSTC